MMVDETKRGGGRTVHDGQAYALAVSSGSMLAPDLSPISRTSLVALSERKTNETVHPDAEIKQRRAHPAGFAPIHTASFKAPKDRFSGLAEPSDLQAWSVHDGKAFAVNVRSGRGRAPREREILMADPHDMAELISRWATERGHRDSDWDKNFQRVKWKSEGRTTLPRSPRAGVRSNSASAGLRKPRILTVEQLVAHESAESFSDYKMVSQLGMGQFATVYHAVHVPTGEPVAIKITTRPIQLPPPCGASSEEVSMIDPMDVDCFTLEASCLLALRAVQSAMEEELDDNIVSSYRPIYRAHGLVNLDKNGARGWIAMRLVDGISLLRHYKTVEAPSDLPTLVGLMRDIARELATLHELGIIHRDLKETNVMVSTSVGANGEKHFFAELVDFGLALSFEPPIDQLRTDFQLRLRVGVYGYMPPEVFKCQPYGPEVDVFSFGVLLFRSLKVAMPRTKSLQLRAWLDQLPFKMTGAGYVDFCMPRVGSNWPKKLSSLVLRCCAADPQQRPTMVEVYRTLDVWLGAMAKV